MKLAIAGLTSAALLAGPVAAFGGGDPAKTEKPQRDPFGAAATFERLDVDRDGKVNAAEVPESSRTFFDRLLRISDTDKDGALSRDEFLESVRPSATSKRRPVNRAVSRPGSPSGKGRNGDRLFQQLDRNGDDRVTLDEVPKPKRPLFKRFLGRADSNEDRILTREEWSRAVALGNPGEKGTTEQAADMARPRRRPLGLFQMLDANGDRRLSEAELADAPRLLEKLDRDGDGAISIDELAPDRPGNGNGPNPKAGRPRFDLVAGVLKRFDTDDDGKISKEEAPEAIKRRFSRIDRDRNDVLDKGELARHFSRRPNRSPVEKRPGKVKGGQPSD